MNIQQLRTQIAALQDATMDENKNFRSAYDEGKFDALSAVDALLDSLQEETVKDRFVFKAIPRLLDMIEPTDKAKSYVTKLADAFDSEGYYTDAKIVRESLKIMNGEKVPMATMDEEPVSEELEEEIKKYLHEVYDRDTTVSDVARHFAKWQKQRMMKDAITATILPANLEETEFCLDDYDEVKHITRLVKEENLKIGDKVKVIIIKED